MDHTDAKTEKVCYAAAEVLKKMRSIGLPELVIPLAVGVILGILPFWKIFSKAGYPGIMGLAMLVRFLNIIMLFYLGLGMARVARIGDTTKAD